MNTFSQPSLGRVMSTLVLSMPIAACSSPLPTATYEPGDAGADAPSDAQPIDSTDASTDAPPDAPPVLSTCVTEPTVLLDEMNMYAGPITAQVSADSVFSAWSLGSGAPRGLYRSSLATGESTLVLEQASLLNLVRVTQSHVFVVVYEIVGENVQQLARFDIYGLDGTLERSVDVPDELADYEPWVFADHVILSGSGEVRKEEDGAFVPFITSGPYRIIRASVPTDENVWVESKDGRGACRITSLSGALDNCFDLPSSINNAGIYGIQWVDRSGDDTLVWAIGDQGKRLLRFPPGGQVEEVYLLKSGASVNAFAVFNGTAYWLEQHSTGMLEFKTVVRNLKNDAFTEFEGQAWLGGFYPCSGAAEREGVAAVKSKSLIRFPLP